jgi:hypothetical protein
MSSGGSGEVRSKMDAAATGPCCLDFDLDSLDEELGSCNLATRMSRPDSIKFRIRKGNAADAISRRGPMVSAHMMSSSYVQNYARVVCMPLFTENFLFVVPMSAHTGRMSWYHTIECADSCSCCVVWTIRSPAAGRSRQILAIIADPNNF